MRLPHAPFVSRAFHNDIVRSLRDYIDLVTKDAEEAREEILSLHVGALQAAKESAMGRSLAAAQARIKELEEQIANVFEPNRGSQQTEVYAPLEPGDPEMGDR